MTVGRSLLVGIACLLVLSSTSACGSDKALRICECTSHLSGGLLYSDCLLSTLGVSVTVCNDMTDLSEGRLRLVFNWNTYEERGSKSIDVGAVSQGGRAEVAFAQNICSLAFASLSVYLYLDGEEVDYVWQKLR